MKAYWHNQQYRKTPKNLDTQKLYCNNPKILLMDFS